MSNPFQEFNGIVQEDVSLAPLTWYRIGGPARYMLHPQDPDQLRALARRCVDANLRVLVLGLGANLLVAEEGVNAAVFRLDARYWQQVSGNSTCLTAGAGTNMQDLAHDCVRKGLAGLQCMAGIPGTVGGCIRMNAGGKFGEVSTTLTKVTVMSLDGEIFDRGQDDLVFSYRRSNISATFILAADFKLEEDSPDELVRTFKEIWMFKKNSQPLNTKNAGCIFKNPEGFSAGALIDQAGLKGHRIGNAEISPKHANFIVAHPDCRAADILQLIDLAREKVQKIHGITLEQEVVVWK